MDDIIAERMPLSKGKVSPNEVSPCWLIMMRGCLNFEQKFSKGHIFMKMCSDGKFLKLSMLGRALVPPPRFVAIGHNIINI